MQNSKLLIFFIVVALICIILFYKPRNKKNNFRTTNLKASLFTATDDPQTYYIQVDYQNPSSFGDNATFGAALFYILDGNTAPSPDHPSIDAITTGQTYLAQSQAPFITDFESDVDAGTAGGNVTGYINRNKNQLDPTKFTPVSGSSYVLGISIMNDKPSISGKQPILDVYGNFAYTVITIVDPPAPGNVTITSGEITVN
jgi:hypothetical protein